MKVGDLVRITKNHNAGKIGVITGIKDVQYVPAGAWSTNYLVLYQGWSSPYPFTENEIEVINESR